jgi:bifunctional ADP-heptose synthase (sugar kinase/adenylyltransferase)
MNYNDVFDSFSNFRVVVVGDVMLDNYKIGKVHRMSPEAPVPVVLFEKEENRFVLLLDLMMLGKYSLINSQRMLSQVQV